MLRHTSPASRWPLALTLALLGACANDATAPLAPLGGPDAAIVEPNVVNNTNDSGIGSLRWTLSWTVGGETIRFDPSLAGQTIALDSTLNIRKPVTIEGSTGAGITIDARGNGPVFRVPAAGTTTLRNLSITGGNYNNAAGGAIFSVATLVLENTVVHGNTGSAGTIVFSEGNLVLINSTVSGNTSADAASYDWAAVMGDTVTLINSTVANNAAGGVGTDIALGQVILRNSILSNNGGENCAGSAPATAITREGANISDDDTCGGPTQIMIGDPEIGPLADNGGPTKTHALLVGSPAINAGTNCSVTIDQRYTPRDAKCDIGAFEFAGFTTVALTIDPGVSVNQSSGSAVLSGTVQCSRNEVLSLAVQLVQQQKTGKSTTTVDAANIISVECSTTRRPWVAPMVLTSGSFQVGSATANAQTGSTQPWVTPASATGTVKLSWSRK